MRLLVSTVYFGFGVLICTACSSSSEDSPNTAAGTCGVTLGWEKDAAACQSWMDRYCCDPTLACSKDSACSTRVQCINDCPVPRQDACVQACGEPGPAMAA